MISLQLTKFWNYFTDKHHFNGTQDELSSLFFLLSFCGSSFFPMNTGKFVLSSNWNSTTSCLVSSKAQPSFSAHKTGSSTEKPKYTRRSGQLPHRHLKLKVTFIPQQQKIHLLRELPGVLQLAALPLPSLLELPSSACGTACPNL